MSALRARLTLCFGLFVLIGCGGEEPTPTETHVEPISVPTVEVKTVAPSYDWTIEQTLTEYLEANSRELQSAFEIDADSGERVGEFPVELVAGEYRIQPNVVSRLLPGNSARFYVDTPTSASLCFVVVRTEDGYRVSVDRTNRYRESIAEEEFRRKNGLDRARLVVDLLGLQQSDRGTYQAKLRIMNASKAPVEAFEISILAQAPDGSSASTKVSGEDLTVRAGNEFVAEFESLPAANVRLSFRLLEVKVTLKSGESFDAAQYFRVTNSRKRRQ